MSTPIPIRRATVTMTMTKTKPRSFREQHLRAAMVSMRKRWFSGATCVSSACGNDCRSFPGLQTGQRVQTSKPAFGLQLGHPPSLLSFGWSGHLPTYISTSLEKKTPLRSNKSRHLDDLHIDTTYYNLLPRRNALYWRAFRTFSINSDSWDFAIWIERMHQKIEITIYLSSLAEYVYVRQGMAKQCFL